MRNRLVNLSVVLMITITMIIIIIINQNNKQNNCFTTPPLGEGTDGDGSVDDNSQAPDLESGPPGYATPPPSTLRLTQRVRETATSAWSTLRLGLKHRRQRIYDVSIQCANTCR